MTDQPLPATPLSVPVNRYVTFFSIASLGLWWDLYSKWAVFKQQGCCGRGGPWIWPDNWGWDWLSPYVRFQLNTNLNEGALWGMGQGKAHWFATLSVFAAIAILYWLFIHKAAASKWLTVALGFVMSGVLGNLYDRLGMHGLTHQGAPIHAVRDFLHFWFFEGTRAEFNWAIFNFADVFLVTGAIMLVIQSLFLEKSESPAAAASMTAANSRA